ncbi:TIGR00341 family protein [Pedobacter changchengzhani]|uniref:TIGR00341 family protein n=1 Tax=Pedobacter changchengzhani TaxID=2529274 RepID=A0A4V3A041_9SPHI|nr:TIGR00341 family protein [Pedobacter changchengzhani]TDG35903.1 TIGR00341 family protein [Pedobacter changchengzhani]
MIIKKRGLLEPLTIFLRRRFSLHLVKSDEIEVVSSILNNSVFVRDKLWILIFAIIIASIGLNVNSTAVVIGAMLISPLMGPIMGIGLGIGTNDFELVKKGGRNLLVATIIGIATSTLYFYITPLHDAQSELLARTTPSIWDVFIAFAGGLAGIIAVTSREKGNVIPGVAIATALMPPLCTAGYGIAMGNWYFFLGAIYLYFINSLFICISTYLIVRFLNFNKKRFADRNTEKRVSKYILILVLITIIPSIYLAYGIVEKSIFENNAQKFVKENFAFQNTQVINKNFKYSSELKEIDLLLIGVELTDSTIKRIEKKLKNYKLLGTKLKIRQGLNAKQEIDFSQIKASIMEDVFKRDTVKIDSLKPNKLQRVLPDVSSELNILFPLINTFSLNNVIVNRLDSTKKDTITLFTAEVQKKMLSKEKVRLEKWIKVRVKNESVRVILQSK